MLAEIGGVTGSLSIRQSHDQHVAAFLKGLRLVVASRVPCRVRIVRAEVMHGILVGVLAGLLVDEQWVEQQFE